MFRKMRRAEKKAIPNEETIRLLQESKRGVLAVAGDDDYPYAVPINYYYDAAAGKIYFHSSLVGHKVDAMKRNPKICFTVYGEPEIKDLDWAPYVKSAVVFGKAQPVADSEKKRTVLKTFAMKYYPEESMVDQEIADTGRAVQLYEIDIEYITGKEVQER